MSTATAPLAAGFTLTGTTFARDTAPVFYEISGPSFGQAIGEQYDLRALRNVYQKTAADGKIEVYIDNLLLKRFDTSGEAASVIASITQAVVAIDRSIQQQATTAAPAPKPTPTPVTSGLTPQPVTRGSLPSNTTTGPTNPVATGGLTPQPVTRGSLPNTTANTTTTTKVTANAVTKTTVTNTTNTTATTKANTTVTSNSVTKTTVTNVTNTSSGSKTVVTAPKKPVANTADVQTVTTVSDLPIKIVTDPITVDVPTFNRSGNVTGNTQVTLKLDPVTINDEPIAVSNLDPGELGSALVNSDELAAIAAQAGADGAAAIAAAEEELRVAAADQDQFVFQGRKDWRVRLSLSDAPEVNYLYRAPNPGILNPLNATNGVLFPYTPTISVNYTASYNPTELVHSNYKVFQYSSSSIDSITLSCDFTAQSTYEADYLLAVIHFFRSATKMFYGQDENPRRGTPPPLCYIYGMGSYQFAGQPLAISQFSYNLPNNVDYIKTSSTSTTASTSTQLPRLAGTGAAKGGVLPPANFAPLQEPDTISWVPSKIQLQITCVPMLSRNAVSNKFSLEQYATGALLNGIGKPGGGFW